MVRSLYTSAHMKEDIYITFYPVYPVYGCQHIKGQFRVIFYSQSNGEVKSNTKISSEANQKRKVNNNEGHFSDDDGKGSKKKKVNVDDEANIFICNTCHHDETKAKAEEK